MQFCGQDFRVSGKLLRTARPDADKFVFLQGNPEAIAESMRNSGARIDLLTFMQPLPGTPVQYSYPMEWDNLAAITITTFDDWWMNQLGFKARNKAKQAGKKGVILREVPFSEELTRSIWEIYNETPIRQGRRFPHYGKSLAKVHAEASTYLNESIFIGAFLEDKMIGFIKILFDPAGMQAGLLNIVSLISHRDKVATNALVAEAVKACAARGVRYLTYSNFSYGKKQKDSLSDFKERNGFQRLEVPRYFIPLTPLGRAALRLGLHREIRERIPESLAERIRTVRQNWYSRRYSSLAEGS